MDIEQFLLYVGITAVVVIAAAVLAVVVMVMRIYAMVKSFKSQAENLVSHLNTTQLSLANNVGSIADVAKKYAFLIPIVGFIINSLFPKKGR